MAHLFRLLFFITTLTSFQQAAANIPNDEMFTVLLDRIDRLEASEAANKREIASLQSEMRTMKTRFLGKEESLLSEINDLKSKLSDNDFDQDVNDLRQKLPEKPIKDDKKDDTKPSTYSAGIFHRDLFIKEEHRSMEVREAVETEVAFYATHSHHDVQHLGQNQIIVFDQAITNIGNKYNSHNGRFVAPVAGTYVFHVTMMGRDAHAVTRNHFNAYIDVDGMTYSQLWVVPHEQSSQMFIIELSAGKTVSVKNHILDDGFVGQHMSTFSGFLLYEHYSSPAIVGK
ncbi:uncharacterized protein LOC123550020 [Mercenaria mercenaria]|uniref:uncharacterized protein LOC123550020 n=1 Tax=Mercenaria mercenaria TaxID=6596 RepID=UPI001E1DCCA5|nr:uncharacterized protein LOC123550020 [Mercenaria mercenaria]